MIKKKIFLTGATGNMGSAGLQELLKRTDRFKITILVRRSKKNIKKLSYLQDNPNVRIVWGDLLNYNDVLASVNGADYVLHVGGMVSPQADYYPEQTMKVNVESAQNIVKAVLSQPNADKIKVVYIGSVAQTGFYEQPYILGRVGDPISAAKFDSYAVSKSIAERIIVDSGIKNWASLRQSGILYPGIIFNGYNPIIFHVPLRGVLEWATVEDSGRLLANVCEDGVAEEFWNKFYNISSGKEYRMTNYEFECELLKALHCPKVEKIFNPEWFALKNFHGQWYSDSDELERYLHFRSNISRESYFRMLQENVPRVFVLAKIVPHIVKLSMRFLAYKKEWGTMYWIKHRDEAHIEAFYGSYETWKSIPDWDHFDKTVLQEAEYKYPTHGFDEQKDDNEIDINDIRKVAEFRGGKCISKTMERGDMTSKLDWQCEHGHTFKASPRLVMRGGHWCEECLRGKE